MKRLFFKSKHLWFWLYVVIGYRYTIIELRVIILKKPMVQRFVTTELVG